ncbi:MAG: YdiU family protein [Pseudohongiellaceae bacterium]
MPNTHTSFQFENSYADDLPDTYVEGKPMEVESPQLLQFNHTLAAELGLDVEELSVQELAEVFSGQKLLNGSRPIAQAYAGHQFGGFSPQLGDGRGLLLGEAIDSADNSRDVALKGSGPTVFSRGGDGKAAVGAVLREYLIGEAMYGLRIPSTRALAAVATGQQVYRERPLPGAIFTRVAASHIRVGTFQFFAARQQNDQLRKLADYSIERHEPQLSGLDNRYLLLLQAVADKQAKLIADWMLAGFIHGVMNTDNMAVSGETIDYGPCAFMEAYDPNAVFSSIDTQGRYAYKNQPPIGQWNLTRFAETLLPVIDEEDPERAVPQVEEILNGFVTKYETFWLAGAQAKLGLDDPMIDEEKDRQLINQWLTLLEQNSVDYTLAWRFLADAAEGNSESLLALFDARVELEDWLGLWRERTAQQSSTDTAAKMRRVNPIYIPRNHLVEEALDSATLEGDYVPFQKLLAVLENPFEEREGLAKYAKPAPQTFTADYQTFCGT